MLDGASEFAPGLREDQQRHAVAAVQIAVGAIICGADLDAADVAQPRHAAVIVRFLTMMLANCSRRRQPAERLHVDLVGAAA